MEPSEQPATWASEDLVRSIPRHELVAANDSDEYNGCYGEYLWYETEEE